ncbi:MAG TPA: DUF3168 domain-containing protein [Croceibacterium sp.]|nr:DUF3168 domain-containing protein [Croceibacterium sp.]
METQLRAALIGWLQADAILANLVNAVAEEAPSRASPPWLGLAASASADWSTKDRIGREVRIALELRCRGDDPATAAATVQAIEARIEALPRAQPGFEVANLTFLRARAEQRPGNARAVLLEYRFRLLAQ